MKKIEEHTKKKLMSVVRDYNLHHAIRNYSKLKKADLIKKMVKYVAYNENTHQFTRRKKLKSRPTTTPQSKAKVKPKRRVKPKRVRRVATTPAPNLTQGQQTEANRLGSLARRAAAMDATYTDILF